MYCHIHHRPIGWRLLKSVKKKNYLMPKSIKSQTQTINIPSVALIGISRPIPSQFMSPHIATVCVEDSDTDSASGIVTTTPSLQAIFLQCKCICGVGVVAGESIGDGVDNCCVLLCFFVVISCTCCCCCCCCCGDGCCA